MSANDFTQKGQTLMLRICR